MASTDQAFFMVTQPLERLPSISPGHICFTHSYKYAALGSSRKLRVVFMGSSYMDHDVEVSHLEKLSQREAELLRALPEDAERLKRFRQKDALQAALGLKVGTEVEVELEEGGARLRGVIRFIGQMDEPRFTCPTPGTFFGIELQGSDRGKGNTDGYFQHRKLFSCEKNCGVLAPFSRVQPLGRRSRSESVPESSDPEVEGLSPGDRVTFFIDDDCLHGMVVTVEDEDGQRYVHISTDTDGKGNRGGEVKLPLQCVMKGEVPAESEHMDVDRPDTDLDSAKTSLTVNSLVEVTLGKGNGYGIIRWIGNLPGRQETMAGLELEAGEGVSDGTFKDQRLFWCPPRRALFVKLTSCRPDSRFQNLSANQSQETKQRMDPDGECDVSAGRLETVPPVSTEHVRSILIGRMKGIQGHCNSCYMDTALFSLFSCSSVLDSMLFKCTEPQDAPIQKTLLHDIVNPLRSQGFVEARHIMKLRQQLQKHGYSRSFTTDEKDPEEFLTVIMHHILTLDPLLKLSTGGKVQESYYYQIFLDQNHSLVLPTVQQLLEHSFHSSGLKLAEVPSCFILQMPRFGKRFKMFDKIIPSLELDVTDLLSEGLQQCIVCGSLAEVECPDCFKDPAFSPTGFKTFCRKCSSQVHCHLQRRSHQTSDLDRPSGFGGGAGPQVLSRDRLDLFAVLCIETSHYVSFIKYGPDRQDWMFFDSMADRQGESDGFNIPEVHMCPEVGFYLDMCPAELANQVPRDMKGVAKRLFCDAYMYLYQSNSMCLYR